MARGWLPSHLDGLCEVRIMQKNHWRTTHHPTNHGHLQFQCYSEEWELVSERGISHSSGLWFTIPMTFRGMEAGFRMRCLHFATRIAL